MQDKHHDSLEDFFRKGSQKYEFEFVEEDWRKMEAKLDSAGHHRPNKWLDFLKKLFLVLGIVAVTWFGYYYLNNTATEFPMVEETASARANTGDASTESSKTDATNPSNQNNSDQAVDAQSEQINSGNARQTSASKDQQAEINSVSNAASTKTDEIKTRNQTNGSLTNDAKSPQIDVNVSPKRSISDNQPASSDSATDDGNQQVKDENRKLSQQSSTQSKASAGDLTINKGTIPNTKSEFSKVTNVKGNPKIDASTSENLEIEESHYKDLNKSPIENSSVILSDKNDPDAQIQAESIPKVAEVNNVSVQDETNNTKKDAKAIEVAGNELKEGVEETTSGSKDNRPSINTKQSSLQEDKEQIDADQSGGGSGKSDRIIYTIANISSLPPDLGPARFNQELGSVKPVQGKMPAAEEEVLAGSSSWAIGVIAAPDFSSVGLVDNLQPGKKLGISIEYPISRRFSISTAIVRSTNNYKVQGDTYRAPAGFWRNVTNGIVPESVSAKCEILDIPINLRYTISDKPKNRLFISSGFSTYFMLNEQYDFTYRPINPGPVESWEVSNENQHVFGIVNFSAGYEFLMANNLSFQVEPFLKIPITDIGFGRVDLFSTGALFSLKYHFTRSRLRPLRIKK